MAADLAGCGRRHGAGGGGQWPSGGHRHLQSARLWCAGRTVRHPGSLAGRCRETIGEEAMRKSNFALRLQPALLDEARKLAAAEGVALNQLINVAVAEKVSALRTESYIAERAARAS